MKRIRPSGLTLLAGTLLLLMPALALLQFRWVGQVSDAERQRMQRNVEVAAVQFAESFDREVGIAFRDLQVSALSVRDATWDRYATRFDDWTNNAPHPRIVKNVYLVDAPGGQLSVRRWDPSARLFQIVPWPETLKPWQAAFEEELKEFLVPRGFERSRDLFADQEALLVRPLNLIPGDRAPSPMNPTTGARPTTLQQVFGYTVIELDPEYIREVVLPQLAQRHFSLPNGESYRVAVVTAADPSRVVYRSAETASTNPAQADAMQGLFVIGRPRGAGGTPRDQRIADARRVLDEGTPARPLTFEELPGRWRLLVQHESGSLEAAVSGARTRNLALSFGVLILLSLSIGLLTVTSRRSERLARQQMEFVAGVSHELRTPVAVIKSAAENLSQGVVGNAERVKRYGQMIEGEARRLGEMVERVLQYAGIEAGLGYGAKAPLAPAEIVDAAIDSALPLLGPDNVTVHREIADDLPPVMGDAPALRSAVQNLVANAVKYGGPDRWVGVKAALVRQGRTPQVRITVSDHGPGIPPHELPHIFEPFYRGGDALAQQIHGNGLGLSLVKRIVVAHGGKVTVTTRAGAGTTFTIDLPAAEPDASPSIERQVRAAVHT